MDTWQALHQCATASGPPGYEDHIGALVSELWRPYVHDIHTDSLGNVMAHRGPTRSGTTPAPAIMLATHIDEIAMMVSKIDSAGFLRPVPLGGVDLRIVCGQEVCVHGRTPLRGIVTAPYCQQDKTPTWDDLCIDVGIPSEAVQEQVSVGDTITFAPPCVHLQGERVAGKAFDNRASVVAVWEALRRLERCSHAVHIYAVATVQEEVGLRGAMVSTFGITPQAGIAIDVGFGAMPGLSDRDTLALGKGPGITLGANIHRGIRERLIRIATQENIPWQLELAPGSSGTDAWGMQGSQAGVPTVVISVPLRYMHSPVECVDLADLRTTGRLLANFLADADPAEVWGWAHGAV